jgi:hypothetical protein
MKSILIALTLVSSMAMANEAKKEETAKAPVAAATEVKKEEVKTEEVKADAAAPVAKKTKKQAKEECLKENAGLKGKELNACVKSKTM